MNNLVCNCSLTLSYSEGTIESTGMVCQARTSYLNREIRWGERFMPMLFLDQHHFSADHSMFHSTYEVRMPIHSARKQDSINTKGNMFYMIVIAPPCGYLNIGLHNTLIQHIKSRRKYNSLIMSPSMSVRNNKRRARNSNNYNDNDNNTSLILY